MDKRGFTLIELLATVIIIAIIMTLILPSALRVSKKNSKRIYGEYENMMVEYAKVSLLNNQDVIDLIDLEELEKVKMECSGYVEIDHNTNPPQYSPYITCGDKYTTANYNRSYAKTIVPIPVCKNAIYNGNNQLLVESNEAYTITNGTRKDVGKQNVTLSLKDTDEYIWVDSTFENKTLNDCEIKKREITVTADSKTMNYGESVPSNSYTIENTINGVDPLDTSVVYTYKDVNGNSVTVSPSTPVGVYNIVPSSSVSDNYSLKLENGVLIIMRNVNAMIVTNNQSWSTTFASSVQEKTFTGATNAQGSVTYTISSQNKGTTSVNYFSIPNNTINKIQMAAGTPAGDYSVVISVTAQGDANHLENTMEITLNVTVKKASNSIAVTDTQSWSPTFSTNSQDKSFTAATGGQGSVTYAIQSQKKGSTTVSAFSIPTNTTATLRIAASTGVGTYTVVIRATAAGNSNYNSGYKDITMTVIVGKANNPIAVTSSQSWSEAFATSAKTKTITAATGAQGSVTYAIQSQPSGSYFTISGTTLTRKASTPVGTYSVVIRATAAGNDNYNSGYKDITMSVTVSKASNPIAVTASQSWSPTFSTSNQDKSFTAATGGQGSVTYAIQSQKKGSTTVSAFTIPTNTTATLRMAASTGVGTYTVVIRATAAGNDNYNSGYKDITMTVTVGKASNPIAVTASQSWSEAFATSAKTKAITAATNAQGSVTYAIQSQPSGSYFTISGTTLTRKASTPAGTYSVVIRATAAGNDNYNSGYKDITMSVTVGRAGISFPTCTSVYYNGSSQTLFAANTSGNYTNSAITGTNTGTYKGNLTPTANYQWSSGSNVTSARELSCVINASEALNTVNGVTTGYATLQAAFNASTTGTTKLLKDITGAISIASSYNKTIDFNNKKAGGLTNSGTVVIKNGKFEGYDGWMITNYATMTINDTSINYTSVDTGCAIVNYKSGSTTPTMTLNNVTINSKSNSLDNDGGTMYATNVKITNDGSGVEVWNKHGGKITFTGGSVSAGNMCAHDNCAAHNNSLANSNDLLTIVNTTVGSSVKAVGKVIHIKTVTHNNLPFVMTGLLNYASSSDSLECPTWTTANGQDDIIWHGEEASVSPGLQSEQGGKYCYFARHNNETGTYSTHFYVNSKFVTGTNWTWN